MRPTRSSSPTQVTTVSEKCKCKTLAIKILQEKVQTCDISGALSGCTLAQELCIKIICNGSIKLVNIAKIILVVISLANR